MKANLCSIGVNEYNVALGFDLDLNEYLFGYAWPTACLHCGPSAVHTAIGGLFKPRRFKKNPGVEMMS